MGCHLSAAKVLMNSSDHDNEDDGSRMVFQAPDLNLGLESAADYSTLALIMNAANLSFYSLPLSLTFFAPDNDALQNFCGKIAVAFSVMICRPKMGKSARVHVDGADGKAWVPLSQYKKESLNLISDGISGILIDGEARIVDPDLFTTDLISVQGIDFLLIPNGVEVPDSCGSSSSRLRLHTPSMDQSDMKKAVPLFGVLLVSVSLSIINFAAAELVIGGMS
ncbi:unnamed protein product [Sphagnum jensenii]|uniref:Uncharacterized protein n=1 Tax=Sphagnum jensenii TaxID=128206 RepID=A0ABP0W2Y4_9BRYO